MPAEGGLTRLCGIPLGLSITAGVGRWRGIPVCIPGVSSVRRYPILVAYKKLEVIAMAEKLLH